MRVNLSLPRSRTSASLKIQCAVGLIQTRQRVGVERAMSSVGRLHTSHGGSAMRIYVSYGAMNFCKSRDFDFRACCFPSSTRSILWTRMRWPHSFQLSNSWQRLYSQCCLPTSLLRTLSSADSLCFPRSSQARNFYSSPTCSVCV